MNTGPDSTDTEDKPKEKTISLCNASKLGAEARLINALPPFVRQSRVDEEAFHQNDNALGQLDVSHSESALLIIDEESFRGATWGRDGTTGLCRSDGIDDTVFYTEEDAVENREDDSSVWSEEVDDPWNKR